MVDLVQIFNKVIEVYLSLKTEALLLLDRVEEAQRCLDEAIPLQSIPLTASTLMYNRALLQGFTENFTKSHAIYSLVTLFTCRFYFLFHFGVQIR